MHTQHNFCTQQVRYVGITRIVILFGLNLYARSRENSFQEVLKGLSFPEPLPRIIHIQHPEDLPSQAYLGKAVQGSATDDY